ncbi:MAG TPA: oxidoreductase, partial [Rhodanobacter sp.]|nr:oxidoreductase [Rhodanobacter sp.]
MNAHPTLPAQDDDESALLAQLRETTALLEALAADRQLLDRLPADERARLQLAVANVYHPDPVARRVKLKAAEKARHAAKVQTEDNVLNQTGIRALRRKPVFTTPNVFAPEGFIAHDVGPDADAAQPRESVEPKHCYVCK